MTRRIVVLGGGFAGLAAARELDAKRCRVTLVDERPAFEFLPNIHELLSGVKSPDLLRLDLRRALGRVGHRFVRDTVTAIDPAARSVSLERRRTPLRYDALIVALGGVDQTRGVEGVVEHAYAFKSVEQCEQIGSRLRRIAGRLERAPVVIVGGGLEGVEALGEILRRYRDAGLRITLVEAGDRLLPEAPASLGEHVRALCASQPVRLELGARVARIEKGEVTLEDGRTLPSALTIWTGGPGAPTLLAQSGLAPRDEWAPVGATLQSERHPEVFVAGDAARLPEPVAKQGYHALDMGVCAGRNAARLLGGRTLRPFSPSEKPTLISFGDLSCFLVLGDRVLAGPVLAAAKEAVFELVMAQLDVQPWWRRLPRALARTERAARELLWPTVTSPEALLRQGRLELLPKG